MSEQLESVADFYRNGHILITGGTGFMGKLMIDKLLRSFSDIDSLYIMVRDKKGSSPEERIFNRLTKEVPNFRSKIKVIPSNIEAEHLGLSPESKQLLVSKVNIIFHCAATLRFDEELQAGVRANLYATRQILNLAKQCANLKVMVLNNIFYCLPIV
ncbi:hypothetical protein M8J76_002155 [Diaphorina citri]|nr:hypothetical protein M8J76_002155 [Diaphorina citri]